MPITEVEFVESWYEKLVSRTNEKDVLPEAIRSLLVPKHFGSCLEIGLGTAPVFANRLADLFEKYIVVEKRPLSSTLFPRITLVTRDWESYGSEKHDIIIASHVIYYFRDKKRAVEKILDSLVPGGRAFIVVNGKDGDYGPLKQAFSQMSNHLYKFTYDELKEILTGKEYQEHTAPTSVNFASSEDLFETLRLSFDQYPEEYEALKPQMLAYFDRELQGKDLVINQKIFEVFQK